MVFILFLIVLLIIALLGASILKNIVHSRIDHTTVATLDLERYMGTWYEIARMDNRFERKMTGVTAQYRLLDGGTIEVINSGTCPSGKRKSSLGHAKASSVPGRLRVSFFCFFYSDYNVMELADDYSWALVGSRTSKYLWILSRTPHLAQEIIDDLKIKAQERGYDPEMLVIVDQSSRE